jgi:hypothetical protein
MVILVTKVINVPAVALVIEVTDIPKLMVVIFTILTFLPSLPVFLLCENPRSVSLCG